MAAVGFDWLPNSWLYSLRLLFLRTRNLATPRRKQKRLDVRLPSLTLVWNSISTYSVLRDPKAGSPFSPKSLLLCFELHFVNFYWSLIKRVIVGGISSYKMILKCLEWKWISQLQNFNCTVSTCFVNYNDFKVKINLFDIIYLKLKLLRIKKFSIKYVKKENCESKLFYQW